MQEYKVYLNTAYFTCVMNTVESHKNLPHYTPKVHMYVQYVYNYIISVILPTLPENWTYPLFSNGQ